MRIDDKSFWFHFGLVVSILVLVCLVCGCTPTPTPSPTPRPADDEVTKAMEGFVKRIESVSVLQTTIFRVDTVVRAKKEGGLFNWGGQNLLLFVQGVVTAGIDLDELDEDDIDISHTRKAITITLPPAKVLSAVLDAHQVENYRGEEPEMVDLSLLEKGLKDGRQQIAETACDSGLLGNATRDSKAAFERILSLVDLGDYQIVVKTTPVTECKIVVE
jgi:hypothetical protein